MTTIYLAGPIAHAAKGGAAWRERVIEQHDNVEFKNPLDKYDATPEDIEVVTHEATLDNQVSTTDIVEGDKELLRESDAVLVGYENVAQVGTPMEVMWAYERDYPIAVWLRGNAYPSNLSPWYHYHTGRITSHAGMAIDFLKRKVETSGCQECGKELEAGYLCDECEP